MFKAIYDEIMWYDTLAPRVCLTIIATLALMAASLGVAAVIIAVVTIGRAIGV